MITVVHIITKLEMGGAQENTLYTCRHLDRKQFRVILIHGTGGYLDHEAAAMPNTEDMVFESLVREINPKKDMTCLAKLSSLLRSLRRSGKQVIVHTHSSKAGILGRMAAKAAGIKPIIHSIHGFSFHEGQALPLKQTYIAAEKLCAAMTHGFIGVSASNLKEARARGIITAKHKVALIRSGFDVVGFAKEAQASVGIRAEFGISDEDELIVCIANLKAQKDPITMVRAMAKLITKRPQVRLLYAGDGPLRGEVEQEIKQLGLEKHFILLGWRRDVPALMGAADLIALSSIFEGLPRVSVQAVVARKPFVGTRVDGTPEIITEGKNGFLVKPRDPQAFCDALEQGLETRPIDPEDELRIRQWDADEMVRAQERFYAEFDTRRST
jgi:glycosyltransferase involved in cell wall biosynthesis